MKQKKLLSLGTLLLLVCSQLFAQQRNPKLTLKSGDWFETGIRISNATQSFNYYFDVRYEVTNKMPNEDLVFKVSIERMRLKYSDTPNIWMGYDSYYPPYLENRKRNIPKQIYEIIANGQGKISKLKSLSKAQKINFSLINVKTRPAVPKAELSSASFLPESELTKISGTIISSLIEGRDLAKILNLQNSTTDSKITNAVLKLASFKLPKNALIKGNIINLSKADSIYEFNKEIFRFNKDGSFKANVLVGLNARRLWVFGQFDEYKTFSVLLQPLDTLIVKADALDFDKTLSFSGNAAAKASLSKDLEAVYNGQWVNESNYRSKSLGEFLSFQKQGQKDLDGILEKYAHRVPQEFLNECRTYFKYAQAGTKLMYFSHYRDKVKPNSSLEEFPKDFFLSIDTLPVAMSGVEGGLFYGYYLTWLLSYQQTKLGMVNADKYGFQADYATAMASFEGYPLHFSVYEALKKALHKNEVESTERLKNYYEDFIYNCGDTILTNRIKEIWTQARLWVPGNPSPVKQLMLSDGSALNLAKFKGKPLVLIVNNNNPDVLKRHIDLIKKQNGKDVHFVVAQTYSSSFGKSDIHRILEDLPNVTYVQLHQGHDKQKNFDLYYLQTKVFAFDSDFRVLAGYLFDETDEDGQAMQDLVKKAIDSNVMTKEQKAELIKTIGWSAGSILFASLIFFWIYKARVANVKRKESLKRQIKELEIKAIRSQMNPHFMFNALNSIQSLINNYQYKEANVYLEKFALLMRKVLNNSEKNFVTLSDELDAILLYCELEQLRFNFKFEIEVSPEVNTQLMEIPGMIIQPLVENSILHGLAQKGDAGLLSIHIDRDQTQLKIVVRDNGPGLKGNVNNGDKSFGLKLVRERLMLLNAGGSVGELHLSSNLGENESGATAVLIIPID